MPLAGLCPALGIRGCAHGGVSQILIAPAGGGADFDVRLKPWGGWTKSVRIRGNGSPRQGAVQVCGVIIYDGRMD